MAAQSLNANQCQREVKKIAKIIKNIVKTRIHSSSSLEHS